MAVALTIAWQSRLPSHGSRAHRMAVALYRMAVAHIAWQSRFIAWQSHPPSGSQGMTPLPEDMFFLYHSSTFLFLPYIYL
jgi:hypothetical protein